MIFKVLKVVSKDIHAEESSLLTGRIDQDAHAFQTAIIFAGNGKRKI